MITPNIAPIAEAWHKFFSLLYQTAEWTIALLAISPLLIALYILSNKLIDHVVNN